MDICNTIFQDKMDNTTLEATLTRILQQNADLDKSVIENSQELEKEKADLNNIQQQEKKLLQGIKTQRDEELEKIILQTRYEIEEKNNRLQEITKHRTTCQEEIKTTQRKIEQLAECEVLINI